jgi:hypothetical protein
MFANESSVPHRQDALLHRPRLLNHLHQDLDRALTLVAAPTGYGKTCLLTDFSRGAPFPVCWLTLTGSDSDLLTFVEHMIAAVRQRFPGFGWATQQALAVEPGLGHSPTTLAGVMIRDMLGNVPEFFVLILDDYYLVDECRPVNALLGAFLLDRPGHCHLVVSTRRVPRWFPIIELVAYEQFAGVGPAHLAFRPQEVQALLAQTHNLALSSAQAEEIVAWSGGWIAAVWRSTQALWRGMRDSLAAASLHQVTANALQHMRTESGAALEQALQELSQEVAGSSTPHHSATPSPAAPSLQDETTTRRLPPTGRLPSSGEHPTAQSQAEADTRNLLQMGDLTIDLVHREVTLGHQAIALTELEFNLLACLVQRRGQVVRYAELWEKVWGGSPKGHTCKPIQQSVSRLRRKLGDDLDLHCCIVNVRGVGYQVR